MSPIFRALPLMAAIALSSPAVAQKLYKVVDENGNVSYQDKPPASESEKVEPKYVDRKGMHLRSTKPKSGAENPEEQYRGLDADGQDLIEPDAPDMITENPYGTEKLDAFAREGGPVPDALQEIPAEQRENAYREMNSNQQTIEERSSTRFKSKKTEPVKQKRRTLSPSELSDIARQSGN